MDSVIFLVLAVLFILFMFLVYPYVYLRKTEKEQDEVIYQTSFKSKRYSKKEEVD